MSWVNTILENSDDTPEWLVNMFADCKTAEDVEKVLNTDDIGTYNTYGDYPKVRKYAVDFIAQLEEPFPNRSNGKAVV